MTTKTIIGFFSTNMQEQFLLETQKVLTTNNIDYFSVKSNSDPICQQVGVTLFPTIVAFKNDRMLRQLVGKYTSQDILNWCNETIW